MLCQLLYRYLEFQYVSYVKIDFSEVIHYNLWITKNSKFQSSRLFCFDFNMALTNLIIINYIRKYSAKKVDVRCTLIKKAAQEDY